MKTAPQFVSTTPATEYKSFAAFTRAFIQRAGETKLNCASRRKMQPLRAEPATTVQ